MERVSGNGLVSDITKPLPEPMLTYLMDRMAPEDISIGNTEDVNN